jgi:hypothetical protein
MRLAGRVAMCAGGLAASLPGLVEGRRILVSHFGEPLRLAPGAPVCRTPPDELPRAA